jgi:protein LTV1
MPRKPVKPFIDKKNASVYHLVRRSERDIGGYYDEEGNPLDVPRNFVMMPTEETAEKLKKRQEELEKQQYQQQQQQQQQQERMMHQIAEEYEFGNESHPDDVLARAKHMLAAADLVDEYDYDKHMLPITGSGVFYGAAGVQVDPSQDVRAKSAPIEEPFIKEIDRQLDAIALSADCLDPELADALFNFEDNAFEEILDDFCLTANQEPDKFQGDENYQVDDFDFDAHIERLIQKAKLEEKGGPKVVPNNHRAWNEQSKEFTKMKPFSKYEDDAKDDDDDYVNHYDDGEYSIHAEDLDDDLMSMNPGVVPKLAPEEEKALCEKFEQALLEYDSDEIGELEDQCYEIRGDKPLEGDIQIEAALDQYLQEKKDEIFILGADYKRDGGGSKVLINGKMVPYNALDVTEAEIGLAYEKADEVLAEANNFLANPEADLPTEEILIDGKSYFEMKEHNPWDCESILSTYSNLDNNPAVIGRSSRRRKKKQNHNQIALDEKIPEDQPVQILLSNKTGLPLGVLPGPKKNNGMDDFDNGTFMSVNKGEARKKEETKEEKKARKAAVKQDRQMARIEKKMMRFAINDEFSKRTANVNANDVGGKTVFKYN